MNDKMIFTREKLYIKFEDKNIVVILYFLPSFWYASEIFRNSNKHIMRICDRNVRK